MAWHFCRCLPLCSNIPQACCEKRIKVYLLSCFYLEQYIESFKDFIGDLKNKRFGKPIKFFLGVKRTRISLILYPSWRVIVLYEVFEAIWASHFTSTDG
jgi:hypothetical protein